MEVLGFLMLLYKNRIVVTGGTGRFAKTLKKIKTKYLVFFPSKTNLNILGDESISITGLYELKPEIILNCEINSTKSKTIKLKCRIDTNKELEYYKAGGILYYVLNEIIAEAA